MWKVSKYRVFSDPYLSGFSPNAGKYVPEKLPYLDTFHAGIASYSHALLKIFLGVLKINQGNIILD